MHERCGTRAAVGAAISLEGQRVSSQSRVSDFLSTYPILQKNTCQSWTPSSWLAFKDRLKNLPMGCLLGRSSTIKTMGFNLWFSHRASPGYKSQAHQEASHALETHLAHFPEDSGAVPRLGPRFSQVALSGRPLRGFQGFQVGSKLGPKNRNLSGYNI